MSTYVVTFCNTGRALFALLTGEGVLRPMEIDAADGRRTIHGTVGAVFGGDRCYIAVQADPAVIAVYRNDWTVERLIEPDEVRDIHGIAVIDKDLLVVSTGTNQVVACHLKSGRMRPFWSGSDALADTLHLNDIATVNGRIVASRFGARRADAQRNGVVFDLESGASLVENLREPHSVAADEAGTIHVLESPSGDLLRCRNGFAPRRVLGIAGYARGLAIGPEGIAIGKSGYRQPSRSGIGDARLAPLAVNAIAQAAGSKSGVFLTDPAGENARFVDTSTIGAEVYSIAACPWTEAPPKKTRRTGSRGGSDRT